MLTLRALGARWDQSLALFMVGVLAVAGCVFAVGYSREVHVSAGSAGALLLLGAFAIAAQGAASVRARQYEIALAQLRGRHGFRLLRNAVMEPTVVLLAATAAGVAVGWAATNAAVHRWVGPDSAFTLSTDEWVAAVIALGISLGVVVVVSWSITYEPLTAKLDNADRPGPSAAPAMFLSLLVLISAVVSVHQARQLGARDAGWVSFLSPALVGLAAGQIGIWLVALGSRVAIATPRLDRRLAWFLTLRRLSRRSDSVAVMRIVVAAAVVAGVAASAWFGSGSWRDQMARLETGGPITFAVPTGGLQAYAASHEADPQGRWLMAMSASPDPSGGSYRDVFVDTPRWDRVAGPFFSGTPVAQVSSKIGALPSSQQLHPARGSTFAVTFDAGSIRRAWPTVTLKRPPALWQRLPLKFTVSYVDSRGTQEFVQVPYRHRKQPVHIRPGVVRYSAFVRGCARACAVETVHVEGLTRKSPVRVTGMSFGDLQLLSAGNDGMVTPRASAHLRVVAVPSGGLRLWVNRWYTSDPLLEWKPDDVQAALATPGLRLERAGGRPQAYGPDGASGPVRIAGDVPAFPLIGRTGLLLDLGTALQGAGPPVPDSRAVVVARADTPASVLRDLMATGAIGGRFTVQQTLTRIQQSPTAQRNALYALIAGFGLLIAAVSVVSSTARQRRERQTEAASLRAAGVDVRAIGRGYRVEAAVLGAAVVVVAAVATWIGCRALLDVLPLVNPGQFGLLFDATPRVGLVAAVAVLAGAFVSTVVFWDFRLVARSSPPSMLRDENQ
jgi:putative ABC transport system permease protein